MTYTFQPQFIKADSAVPIRMIVGGWVVGVAAILYVAPVANSVIALMGITLLAGGLIAVALSTHRMWRMILGATAGAVALWLGYGFALVDRLLPARHAPRDLLHTEHLGAVALGLAVLTIGAGGMLEAVRAQAAPGRSPLLVRVYLIALGMVIAAALCAASGVSSAVAVLVIVAAGVSLGALAWLRRQRPMSHFTPRP